MKLRCKFFDRLLRIRTINRNGPQRLLSTKDPEQCFQQPGKMKGWQIHEYGGVELLQYNEHIKIPTINNPTEVLVEIRAASVNPIDVAMMGTNNLFEKKIFCIANNVYFLKRYAGGYGATILNILRCNSSIEFPLTLGRDFSGIVMRKGLAVREGIQVGDKVWGVVPLHRSGCHAEYVLVDENCVGVTKNGFDFRSTLYPHMNGKLPCSYRFLINRKKPLRLMPLVYCMPDLQRGQVYLLQASWAV